MRLTHNNFTKTAVSLIRVFKVSAHSLKILKIKYSFNKLFF